MTGVWADRPPVEPWRRAAARLIDATTVLTVLWVLVVLRVLWFVPALSDRLQPDPWGRAFVVTLSFVVIAAVYEAVFVSRSSGQTPGMDIMKLRVIGSGGEGRVGAVRAVARVLPVLAVPLVRPLWAAIVLLSVLALAGVAGMRPGRRPIIDSLAGTTVVSYDRDQEDPSARRPIGRTHRQALDHDPAPLDPPHRRVAVSARPRTIGDAHER